MGQQRLVATGFLQSTGGSVSERAIARQHVAELGFGNVIEFLARHVRAIERYLIFPHRNPPRLRVSRAIAARQS